MYLKKTLKASEQGREYIKKARAEWSDFQKNLDVERLVFLDETGAKTNMTWSHGRSYRGQRRHDSAPDGRWERISILSAIRFSGSTESFIFDGALDTKIYDLYIEKILLPTIKPGDIVIMDNLNVHKSAKARILIESVGAKYISLPAYSSDLNPIEKMWSKMKQILRSIKARTREALENAIAFALDQVTHEDAKGWFASCGYIKS